MHQEGRKSLMKVSKEKLTQIVKEELKEALDDTPGGTQEPTDKHEGYTRFFDEVIKSIEGLREDMNLMGKVVTKLMKENQSLRNHLKDKGII